MLTTPSVSMDEKDDLRYEWQQKGATLSDKTARKEFGLTQDEIIRAVRAGALHCRENAIYGNPFLRLLRREVEALVKKRHGGNYLQDQKDKKELARVNSEIRLLKSRLSALEIVKSMLMEQKA